MEVHSRARGRQESEAMIFRVGYRTVDEPNTVVSHTKDSNDPETHQHIRNLLHADKIKCVWVRKGAYDVVYLKGDQPKEKAKNAKK